MARKRLSEEEKARTPLSDLIERDEDNENGVAADLRHTLIRLRNSGCADDREACIALRDYAQLLVARHMDKAAKGLDDECLRLRAELEAEVRKGLTVLTHRRTRMTSDLRIVKEVTMAEVRQRARPFRMAFYGANTPWWTSSERDLYTKPGIGLPCDPRGGMLFQTSEGELDKFLKSAEAKPENYGKHGIRAFLAAYHGVVVTADGKPTCCDNWDGYNALLDAKDAEAPHD